MIDLSDFTKLTVCVSEWVQPVCLPAEGQSFTAGKKCFIAGWGREAEGGKTKQPVICGKGRQVRQ